MYLPRGRERGLGAYWSCVGWVGGIGVDCWRKGKVSMFALAQKKKKKAGLWTLGGKAVNDKKYEKSRKLSPLAPFPSLPPIFTLEFRGY